MNTFHKCDLDINSVITKITYSFIIVENNEYKNERGNYIYERWVIVHCKEGHETRLEIIKELKAIWLTTNTGH